MLQCLHLLLPLSQVVRKTHRLYHSGVIGVIVATEGLRENEDELTKTTKHNTYQDQ